MFNEEFVDDIFKFEQLSKSVRKIVRKDESELLHGEEGDMIYKYDLPILNKALDFNTGLILVEEEKEV